jgi:hypothetical protein
VDNHAARDLVHRADAGAPLVAHPSPRRCDHN